MVYRILHKDRITYKSLFKKVISLISVIIIFIFIINNMFLYLLDKHETVGGYKYSKYDIAIREVYRDNYNEKILKECPYIENSLRAFYISAAINSEDTSVLMIDSNSLTDVLDTVIPRKLFIDYSSRLIKEDNSILISYSVARQSKIKVGDIVEFLGKDLKVAGIFESCVNKVVKGGAVVCWDGEVPKGMQNREYNFFDFYSVVYIGLSDYDKGIKYFENNYYKQKDLYVKYGGKATPELIEKLKIDAYSLREVSYSIELDGYNKRINFVKNSFYIALCLIALFTICIYDSYSHAKANEVKAGILRILGCKRRTLFMFYFSRSVLQQFIMVVISIVVMKNITSSYISNALILSWIGVFLIIILTSALLSSVFSMFRLSDSNLTIKLTEEGGNI